jgi:hypothetical protein
MRRLILSSVLALVALAAVAASASAAAAPVITSVTPKQSAIGETLVINGKNFKKGVRNNRVFFSRATDGKTVRVRPSAANSSRRMSVKVPLSLEKFLTIKDGVPSATRFQIQVLSGKFSKKTARSRSPIIFPAGSTPAPGVPGAPVVAPPPPPDCDSDGTPDAQYADDDNDGLGDEVETTLTTNPCAKDSDGDGLEDGYEYWSARDLNNNAVPYPGKKPYPNPLDGGDGGVDFDQDGLTQAEEFAAWSLYGGRVLPSGDGQSFPYSDGNQTSTAGGGTDFDQNTKITDDEKDADGDGLANWIELSKGSTSDAAKAKFGKWTNPNLGVCPDVNSRYQDCGAGPIANGNTFVDGSYPGYFIPNWLDPDTDGDGLNDSVDDQDHDDQSNAAEIAAQTNPVDPCSPNVESRNCQQHTFG